MSKLLIVAVLAMFCVAAFAASPLEESQSSIPQMRLMRVIRAAAKAAVQQESRLTPAEHAAARVAKLTVRPKKPEGSQLAGPKIHDHHVDSVARKIIRELLAEEAKARKAGRKVRKAKKPMPKFKPILTDREVRALNGVLRRAHVHHHKYGSKAKAAKKAAKKAKKAKKAAKKAKKAAKKATKKAKKAAKKAKKAAKKAKKAAKKAGKKGAKKGAKKGKKGAKKGKKGAKKAKKADCKKLKGAAKKKCLAAAKKAAKKAVKKL